MPNQDDHSQYGSGVAFIFIFNLIVGTGALALPKAFAEAGYILSLIIVSLLCITSFISLTFVIESMSIANFIYKSSTCLYKSSSITSDSDSDSDNPDRNSLASSNSLNSSFNIERTPLINCNDISQNSLSTRDDQQLFDITEQMELGHMARLFFKKSHLKFFYICVIVYLFGDLTIYSAAISKSLRDVTCTFDNCTKTELDSYDLCWPNMTINRSQVYSCYILVIGLILGPFFNLHNKYSQLTTTIFRWLAFGIMITLASYSLILGKGQGNPAKSNFSKMPNLFGVCVYSFMCHHSLPRLIQPLKNKRNLYRLISFDYALVLGFYIFLSMTGVFTFKNVEDVYTLNFQKPRCPSSINSTLTTMITDPVVPQFEILELFLPLFPVFVLSTNYPIIALTLGNNLRSLLLKEPLSSSSSNLGREPLSSRLFFPFIVFIPPILISFLSENVELLVSFTGSYAGTFIQYLIPMFLVYRARLALSKIEIDQEQLYFRSDESNFDNSSTRTVPLRSLNKNLFFQNFESNFKGPFWIVFILIWSIFCLLLVTINHFV